MFTEQDKKIFRTAISEDSPIANNAVNIFRNRIVEYGMNPIEVGLWDSREGGHAAILISDNEELGRRNEKLILENAYLIEQLEKLDRLDLVKKARKIGGIDYHWIEFVEAVEKKITLGPGWQSQVARQIGVTVSTIEKWRFGFEEIPAEIFEQIKELKKSEIVQTYTAKETEVVSKESGKKTVMNDKFPWSQYPEVELEMCSMFVGGDSLSDLEKFVREKVPHIPIKSGAAVNQRIYNTAPPQLLISSVRNSGHTDWAELWLIGITLAKVNGKKGWFGQIIDRIRAAEYVKPSIGDDLSFLSQQWIDSLRAEYATAEIEMNNRLQKKGSELPDWAKSISSVIHSYGPEGISREALIEYDATIHKNVNEVMRYNTIYSIFKNT